MLVFWLIALQAPPLEKLTSEPAIVTVVFVLAGVAFIRYLPGIIAAVRGDGNGKEKERADMLLSAIIASTSAKVELIQKVDQEIHESQKAREHIHAIRNGSAAFQLLVLKLIEHFEGFEGRRLVDERELMDRASEALQPIRDDARKPPIGGT